MSCAKDSQRAFDSGASHYILFWWGGVGETRIQYSTQYLRYPKSRCSFSAVSVGYFPVFLNIFSEIWTGMENRIPSIEYVGFNAIT